MSYILLTPGPTPVPHEILQKLAEPILHHRTPEFGKILNFVFEKLKYVYQTKRAEAFVLSGSGTAALEAAVVNFFSSGERVLVYSIGAFGDRWAAIARTYGLNVDVISAKWGEAAEPEQVNKHLQSHPDTAGVFITHSETSTATVNPIREIGEIVKRHNALYLVDAVSSLGGEEFRQDDWGIDVAASGSQKGLMCPPGIAFLSAGPKALERMKKAKLPRFYFDLKYYQEAKSVPETPFTPPVSLLTGLAQALAMIEAETLEARIERCRMLAQYTRQAAGERLGARLFSKWPANVLTAFYPPPQTPASLSTSAVLKELRDHYKITIADGQGDLKGKIFRIAHMGAITKDDVDQGLSALVDVYQKHGVQCPSSFGLKT